jgi:hypothetical protein
MYGYKGNYHQVIAHLMRWRWSVLLPIDNANFHLSYWPTQIANEVRETRESSLFVAKID